jgi:prepilin signal peptidase PulO-like enzyme (type II secretory pathway)
VYLLDVALALILFLFGVSVGSFLNVVADRVPAGKSIIRPPSYCFNCGHELEPRDLFPIVSYLMLKGKCRYCGKSFTARSMLVELATGLLFALAFFSFGLSWQLAAVIIFISFYIVLFITSLEQDVLPRVIVYPGIALALIIALLNPLTGIMPNFIDSAAGLGVSSGFFLLLWVVTRLFKKNVLGFGDVGMAGLIGASVGFPQVLVALCIAVPAGALTAVLLTAFKGRKLSSTLEFGPFLAFAGLITLFYGNDIFDACSQLFW